MYTNKQDNVRIVASFSDKEEITAPEYKNAAGIVLDDPEDQREFRSWQRMQEQDRHGR
jgi:hypothetical protein